jgi:hypothetical protein
VVQIRLRENQWTRLTLFWKKNLLDHVQENNESDTETTIIDEHTLPDSSKSGPSSSAELVASAPVVPKKGKHRTWFL